MKRAPQQLVDLGIRDEEVAPGSHIALVWETDAEFQEATRFLVRGAALGDHLVIFGHHSANGRVLRHLEDAGVDVERLQRSGHLQVLGGHEAGDEILSHIGATFQSAVDRGATMIRLLGNIGWEKPGWPDEMDLLAFESKVTDAARAFPCVVVCMYDARQAPRGALLHGCFQTHPLTFFGNLIRENPFFVSHDEFMRRIEEAARTDG